MAVSCGGGGGSSNAPPPPTAVPPQFPDRGGGESGEPPPAAKTGRVFFDSSSGEQCCVALDPTQIPGGGLVVLADLPAGPATVVVAYFATDFAPAIPGVTLTCTTSPTSLGRPCDPTQVASPSYESDPQQVDIIPNGQTDVGELVINAKPFVIDFVPEDGETVQTPVEFTFTIGDAVTGVEADSVALELTVEIPEEGGGFRKLTKRLPVTLTPCDDSSDDPCSPDGVLDLVGFRAASDPAALLAGPVDVRILAINQGDPPQDVDFQYAFEVTDTPVATSAVETTAEEDAGGGGDLEEESGCAAAGASAADDSEPVDGSDSSAECGGAPCQLLNASPPGTRLQLRSAWPLGRAAGDQRAPTEGGGG